MNVYFAGGEDIDFTSIGTGFSVSSGPGQYRNTYSRGNFNPGSSGSTWPMAAGAQTPNFGNQSTLWVHALPYLQNTTVTTGQLVWGLADASGIGRLFVRGISGAGFKISTRTAAGVFADLVSSATGLWSVSGLHQFDLYVNYAVSGQATLYFDGVAIADTGTVVDVTTDGATALSALTIGNMNTSNNCQWSEVIVADSDTRSASLWLMNSPTAGNAQTWAGTASNVNKLTSSDTTYISAASAGLIEEFKTGGIALPSGTFAVPAVVMSSRALAGATGPQNLEYVTRVGSTDYVGGEWGPAVGTYGNNANYIQLLNPGTGLAWTTDDLTASTFNYGIESVA